MRAKVDRQSYDELRPGVDAALALLDWFVELQKTFVAVLNDLGGSQAQPSPATLTILGEALDCCIVLENQFGGWSQCINRFSWFKRTFAQIRRDIAAEVDCDKLNRDLSRFQGFIGARDRRHTRTRTRDTEHAALIAPPERMRARRRASSIHPAALCPQILTRPCIRTLSRLLVSVGDSSYPIGMHMTGPLRAAVKKAPGHERLLVACAFQLGASAEGSAGTPLPGAAALAAANLLRPLPYLLYLADGDSGDSYNVFTAQKSARRAHAHAHAHMHTRTRTRAHAARAVRPHARLIHITSTLSAPHHARPSSRSGAVTKGVQEAPDGGLLAACRAVDGARPARRPPRAPRHGAHALPALFAVDANEVGDAKGRGGRRGVLRTRLERHANREALNMVCETRRRRRGCKKQLAPGATRRAAAAAGDVRQAAAGWPHRVLESERERVCAAREAAACSRRAASSQRCLHHVGRRLGHKGGGLNIERHREVRGAEALRVTRRQCRGGGKGVWRTEWQTETRRSHPRRHTHMWDKRGEESGQTVCLSRCA